MDSACGKPHRYAENDLWTVPRQEKQLDADDHGIADMHFRCRLADSKPRRTLSCASDTDTPVKGNH